MRIRDIDFAPMEGITGYVFRRAHHRHFKGIRRYMAPFLSPGQTQRFSARELKDVLPEHNEGVPMIPQILTNRAEHFLWATERLKEFGYREVNLNLGCPSGTVVAKHRGAGFLEFPGQLDLFLDQVCNGMQKSGMDLSIKTRIGLNSPEEFPELLEIFNRYPLKELIVHPRIQREYYKGKPHLETFRIAVAKSNHVLRYNGDLFTAEKIRDFEGQFPKVERIMLGRGMLSNPALAESETTGLDLARLRAFHDDVLAGYQESIPGDRNVLFKMKELWCYLIDAFEGSAKHLKRIRKSQRVSEYQAEVSRLFAECSLSQNPTYQEWNESDIRCDKM